MATEYFNDAWRIPNNKNQSKISNYSMDFNGTSDFVDCGNDSSLQITGAMTVSYWFKGLSATASATGVGKLGNNGTRGFALTRTNGNAIYFFIAPTASSLVSAFATPTLSNTQWYHLVGVYTPSTSMVIYLNGVLLTSTQTGSVPASQYNGSNNLQIGARGDSTVFFNGEIDQVCIFDYALPATGTNSVATLYGGGTAVTNPMALSPKPVAAYQLGDQSVSTGPTADYLVPNNSLQDYVFNFIPNDYIDLGTSLSLPNEYTISCWININNTTAGAQAIIYKGTNTSTEFGLEVNRTSGKLSTLGASSGPIFTSNTTLAAGVWYHAALTKTIVGGTKTYTFFLNGQNDGGGITSTNPNYSSGITAIGRFGSSSGGYFNGEISNLALWNSVLTSSQIASIYNNGSPNDISSLSPTAWYKLNAQDTFDGTNWTIKDYAGSNDGTSNGMTSANLVQSNLQHASGYSPYALSLDRVAGQRLRMSNGIQLGTNKAVSMWIKFNNGTGNITIILSNGSFQRYTALGTSSGYLTVSICEPSVCTTITTTYTIVNDVWFNLIISGDGTTATVYVNGQNSGQGIDRTPSIVDVGNYQNNAFGLDGDLSNLAVWQSNSLTSAQVTEIYNLGVPTNLNTFSGTKPTAWWQLGTNSSFDANISRWTCIDEIGTNDIYTITNDMSNDDIVNGPGHSANGLGTSSIDIKGDAPYSTANGISVNMDVLDRTTDVPS